MSIADQERSALSAALLAAGPLAPTLCEGWSAHHLAAHLWLREHEPSAVLGIAVPALAERRIARLVAERPFGDLVGAFAAGPPAWSPFAIRAVDAAANAAEFFVHHEDVRRGVGPVPIPARTGEVEDWAWRTATGLLTWRLRRAPCSIVIEQRPGSRWRRYGRGDRIVTLTGPASELLLVGFGRTRAAAVSWSGPPAELAAVRKFLGAAQ